MHGRGPPHPVRSVLVGLASDTRVRGNHSAPGHDCDRVCKHKTAVMIMRSNRTVHVSLPLPLLAAALAASLLLGCRTCCDQPVKPVAQPAAPAIPPPPAIRINAGTIASFTDASGNAWLPDQGFADGDTISRDPNLPIANTTTPELYRAERYSMTAFSREVPNGDYTVKLHFAETFEEINGPGQRLFSFNVEGQEFKDFDVFAKAGGVQRALVLPVKVHVADGKLDLTFTANVQNPEINALEIIPGQ